MNPLKNSTGYILFGHKKGFNIYKKSGCALDFDDYIEASHILTKAIRLELESLNKFNLLFSYVHLLHSNNEYTLFIKYFPSLDIFSRSAYNGCALVLKNSKMDSVEILRNISLLSKELELPEENYCFDKELLTETLSPFNLNFENGISIKIGFLLLDTTSLYKFISTANKINYYKVFASDKDIFKNNYAINLNDDFLDNPQESVDKDSSLFDNKYPTNEFKYLTSENNESKEIHQPTLDKSELINLAKKQIELAHKQIELAHKQIDFAQEQIKLLQNNNDQSEKNEKNSTISMFNISTEEIAYFLRILIAIFAIFALLIALKHGV